MPDTNTLIFATLVTACLAGLSPCVYHFLRTFGRVRLVRVPVWRRSLKRISGYREVAQ